MSAIPAQLLPATHLLLFSTLAGSSFYQSFVSAPIAIKTLPILEYRKLQKRVFPTYFSLQAVLPPLIYATAPLPLSVLGLASLSTLAVAGLANKFLVGPWVTGILDSRAAQEQTEGKSYKDEGVSPEMKSLNKKFGQAHGISVLLNLAGLLSCGLYAWELAKAFV